MAFVVIVAAVIAVALAACECDALDYKQGHDQFGEKMDPYHHPPMDQSAPEMDRSALSLLSIHLRKATI